MRLSVLLASALVLVAAPRPAAADYAVDFLRIACVPEARFFEVEHRSLNSTQVDPPLSGAWARQDFHPPAGLEHECDLRGTRYKVVAEQAELRERGACGAAPEVLVSVFRNEVVIVDKVVFGPSCIGNAAITRLSRTEKQEGRLTGEAAEVCFLVNGDVYADPICVLVTDESVGRAFPLRQETLRDQFKVWRPNQQ